MLFDGINPGEKDYSAIVSKLKAAGAEFVYFGGYHTEAGLMLRQAADQGYKFQLISGDGLATAEFWQIAGPAGEGTLFTFAADPRRSPTAAKALDQFKARATTPKASRCSPTASSRRSSRESSAPARTIRPRSPKALKNGQPVDTLLGPIAFDAKGDVEDPHFDINQWHDGKYAANQPVVNLRVAGVTATP